MSRKPQSWYNDHHRTTWWSYSRDLRITPSVCFHRWITKIRGLLGSQRKHQRTPSPQQRRRNISSESRNVRCPIFQKFIGLEMNSRLGKWAENRNHQEENENFSCHINYPSLPSPPAADGSCSSELSFTTNHSKHHAMEFSARTISFSRNFPFLGIL